MMKKLGLETLAFIDDLGLLVEQEKWGSTSIAESLTPAGRTTK
jgi:hypothetical protein